MVKNKKIEVKPIKATTVVYGKYAKAVIEQANTVPSDNFKERAAVRC